MKRFVNAPPVAAVFMLFVASCFGMQAASQNATSLEIQVMSSNAVKEVLSELIPEFQRTTGSHVSISYAPTNTIVSQLQSGAAADLVIASSEAIDDLTKQGKLVRGSRVDLARSGIGIAVRAGTPKPDIRSGESLKAALLAAKSVATPKNGLTSTHFTQVMERLGIAVQMKPKLMEVDAAMVGATVASGQAELGLQQISELLAVSGIVVAGPLPGDFQKITLYSAGLSTSAQQSKAAQALVSFLSTDSALSVIRKKGMDR